MLSSADLQRVWAKAMRSGSCPPGITKQQFYQAFLDTNNWWDTVGQSSFNNGFSQPFKAAASVREKGIVLLCMLSQALNVPLRGGE